MKLHTPITDKYIAHLWNGLELALGVYQYGDHNGKIYDISMINDASQRDYILKMTIDSYFTGSGLRFSEMKTEIESEIGNAHEIEIMLNYMHQKFERLFEKYNETITYIKQCPADRRDNSIELIAHDFGNELADNIDLKLNIKDIVDNLNNTVVFFKGLRKLVKEQKATMTSKYCFNDNSKESVSEVFSMSGDIFSGKFAEFWEGIQNAKFDTSRITIHSKAKYTVYKLSSILGQAWYGTMCENMNWKKSRCSGANIDKSDQWRRKIDRILP